MWLARNESWKHSSRERKTRNSQGSRWKGQETPSADTVNLRRNRGWCKLQMLRHICKSPQLSMLNSYQLCKASSPIPSVIWDFGDLRTHFSRSGVANTNLAVMTLHLRRCSGHHHHITSRVTGLPGLWLCSPISAQVTHAHMPTCRPDKSTTVMFQYSWQKFTSTKVRFSQLEKRLLVSQELSSIHPSAVR